MEIIELKVQRSEWYRVYIGYTIEQNYDTLETTVHHGLYIEQLTDGYDFNGRINITYKINSFMYNINSSIDMDDEGDAGYTIQLIRDKHTVIKHDKTTGEGSFTVECIVGEGDSDGYGPGTMSLPLTTIVLPTIDNKPPTIEATIWGITANSLILTALSDSFIDFWQYTYDNGLQWWEIPKSEGMSASVTINNLSPSLTYRIKVRGRKKSNQIFGESEVHAIKTQGGTVLDSVGVLNVDATNPDFLIYTTAYSSYKHTIVIKDQGSTIVEIPDIRCAIGTSKQSIQLTSEQRAAILNYMWDKTQIMAEYQLITYDGDSRVGDISYVRGIIATFPQVSSPIFWKGVTFRDTNGNTSGLVGNGRYVKTSSTLEVNIGRCTPVNGSKLSKVEITVGSKVESFDYNGATYNFGQIDVSGENVTVRVSLIDSRGYTTNYDSTINVMDYKDVSIEEYSVRRVNEVESTVQLSFSGKFSSLKDSYGNEVNRIKQTMIRYRPVGLTSWSAYILVTPETSGDKFEYTTDALSYEGTNIVFDPETQYEISIWVEDELRADELTVGLNRGTPLVAFRPRKLGINQPHPTATLDIQSEPGVEPLKLNDKTIFDLIYPIGSIYISVNSTNPADIFGGYWVQIKDKFLLACGDTYAPGSEGGEATHTLTVDEMPSHTHNDGTAYDRGIDADEGGVSAVVYWDNTMGTRTTTETGGGQAHNNMPPYLAVYVWMRMIPIGDLPIG